MKLSKCRWEKKLFFMNNGGSIVTNLEIRARILKLRAEILKLKAEDSILLDQEIDLTKSILKLLEAERILT